MKQLLRLLTVGVVLIVFATVVNQNVKAYTISPATGTKTANTTANITINATPQTGENGVKIDLDFTNITVLGFTPASGFLALPECSGGTQFNSSKVCASVVKVSTNLVSGELLGTVQVRWGSVGTAGITATSNNLYIASSGQRVDSGVKGTFTIGSIPSTPLIEKDVDKYLLITSGICLIVLGFYFNKKVKNLSSI